jgi:aminoglycoside 2''-phosphotransferase
MLRDGEQGLFFCYNFLMRKAHDIALIDKYLPIIKSYYPDISPESITLFQDGYDHDVILLNSDQAFRFPRTKGHGKKDTVENMFLPVFAKTSPILVQEMKGRIDSGTGVTYQMYRFIPGIQLTKEVAQTLTEQELITIAKDMGKFLTKLHAFPVEEARSMRMDEIDPSLYWKYFEDLYERIKAATFSLLSKDEHRWVKNLARDYISVTKDKPLVVKVTHHDLLSEHIIIDEKTHMLNGAIDFSLRIADPARDFEFFDRYGNVFLETVYKNYPFTDEHFDRRRTFYAGHVPVINLYESIEKQDRKMIEIHRMQLKDYIAQN